MPPLEAGKARLAALPQAAIECPERLIQTAQHLLDRGGIELAQRGRAGVAKIAKVRPLRRVGDALTRCSVGGDPLLQSGVVQSTPLPQQEVEGWRLGPVRIQAVLVGAAHE